jgi:glucose 1-dehydrogenase
MTPLLGRIALVTGASRGIGRGIALHLARQGADVIVHYHSHPDEARAVAGEIAALGRRALPWQADVADRAAVEDLIAGTIAHFGRLDILVANAGFGIPAPVLDTPWEQVQRQIDVCELGAFSACQLAARQMVRQGAGGKIVVISSVCAEITLAAWAPYDMAKAGINHFAESLAQELTPHRINVNVINPGWIDTPGERAYFSEEEIRREGRRIPWGRIGTPEDVAKAVAFLVGPDADYITGATLRVDGGFVLGLCF